MEKKDQKIKIIALVGPTAVGKTMFSLEVAKRFNCEIVSCDSMQLYKYMDIGSAKPTESERSQVPHHLVDMIDPREPFSVAKYQSLARDAVSDIAERGRTPLLTGGTGLYLYSVIYDMDFSAPPAVDSEYRASLYRKAEEEGPEALYRDLEKADPEAASRIHPNNVKRVVRALEAVHQGSGIRDMSNAFTPYPAYDPVLICLDRNRDELYKRIDERAEAIFNAGLGDEVKSLMEMGLTDDDISMKGIGYKEVINYLNGEYDLDEAVRLVKRNSRHYAKRQLTWFRRTPGMKWFNISDYQSEQECLEDIIKWLEAR
jgi:tRNA dimethylallyltransferase